MDNRCDECGTHAVDLHWLTGTCRVCHEVALNPLLDPCLCCGDDFLGLEGLFCDHCHIEDHACVRGGAAW